MTEYSKLPWPDPIWDNDTGPNDEGYWEWWNIEGIAKFNREDDAKLAFLAVNNHYKLVEALEEIIKVGGSDLCRDIASEALANLKV